MSRFRVFLKITCMSTTLLVQIYLCLLLLSAVSHAFEHIGYAAAIFLLATIGVLLLSGTAKLTHKLVHNVKGAFHDKARA